MINAYSQASGSPGMAIESDLRRSSLLLASYLKTAENDCPWNLFFFVSKTSLAVFRHSGCDTIILQKKNDLIIHFMVFTRVPNVMLKFWSASNNLFTNDSWSFFNKFNNDSISFCRFIENYLIGGLFVRAGAWELKMFLGLPPF